MIDEIRFWMQVMTDAERTVCCSPEMESRIKGWVDARGLSGQITVVASPGVPDDRVYVIDHHAVDAGLAEVLQRGLQRGRG